MKPKMEDFAISLDAMASRYNAAILSIGAQCFDLDTGKLGPTFFAEIELSGALRAGTVDADTMRFMLTRGGDVTHRAMAREGKVVLAEALFNLSSWMRGLAVPKVWAEGNAIAQLEYAYDHGGVGIHEAWYRTNVRNVDTLEAIHYATGWRKTGKQIDAPSNALGDATRLADSISTSWVALLALGKRKTQDVPAKTKPALADDDF